MNVIPPPGPQRRRLFVLLSLLAVAFVVLYYQWSSADPVAAPVVSRTNPVDALLNQPTTPKPITRAAAGAPGAGGQVPEPLKMAQLEKVPDEPEAARNLFRFGAPPPPPPPPPVVQVPQQQAPVGPPPPPPIPPVPLKYTSHVQDPSGRLRAYLVDRSGRLFEAVAGDTVDGQYILHKVTKASVEVSWLDGSGRRTIPLNGG